MTPSDKCEALIKRYEQCRLTAYMPTAKDVPTIGWGSTGSDIHMGMTWTQAQCDARFDVDLARFANSVFGLIGGKATQGQFDALVSFTYNVGAGHLHSSTLLKMHLAGNYTGAAEQFARWNKQAGVVLNGLTIRRAAERALYLS